MNFSEQNLNRKCLWTFLYRATGRKSCATAAVEGAAKALAPTLQFGLRFSFSFLSYFENLSVNFSGSSSRETAATSYFLSDCSRSDQSSLAAVLSQSDAAAGGHVTAELSLSQKKKKRKIKKKHLVEQTAAALCWRAHSLFSCRLLFIRPRRKWI